ncbi:hypothetical protein [uncultured Olleya sp.]|uniref:hypothetical protein n=1 Tax=uncultured Olleya sp. TaxID=757243 RepID=UPI0025945DDC|nr:hypothetical protein [uncultured Olleya sp.]
MKKGLLLFLLSIVLLACKNEQTQITKTSSQGVEDITKELKVKIKFKSTKADNFKLMLNNIVKDEFQTKNIHIIEKVIVNTEMETLNANFGENISNKLIINFGNKEVKTIDFESIDIYYGSNSINILPNQLRKFFNLNKFISLDETSYFLQTKKIEGKHNPSIILKQSAINILTGKKKATVKK